MKLTEVPQDKDPTYEGHTKLCYAVDQDGRIVTTSTNGWSVEQTAKDIAWEKIHQDLAHTRAQLRLGKVSPLTFFMKFRLMDPSLLASNVGTSSLRLRWHLRPRVFRRLSDAWLKRYSECLDIPIADLKNYDGQNEYRG